MYGTKGLRKKGRRNTNSISVTAVLDKLTLVEMFERFMVQKRTEGLAARTVERQQAHLFSVRA
jgi:hypothetical protein